MMFLAAVALAAAPRAVVVVTTAGIASADEAALVDRVSAEVRAAGVDPSTLPAALAMKTDCLREPACARDVLRAGDAGWLVRVELLRGGGNVQITGALLDSNGEVRAEGSAPARIDELLAGKAIVPTAVVAALRALPAPAQAAPPTESTAITPQVAVTVAVAVLPLQSEPVPPSAPPAPTESEGPSTLALTGIGGVAVGGTAAIVGILGAIGQYAVARDPAAIGADKELASVLVPLFGSITVVGVGLGAAGAWLLTSQGEP